MQKTIAVLLIMYCSMLLTKGILTTIRNSNLQFI